jgi:signal transduction histidine kinase
MKLRVKFWRVGIILTAAVGICAVAWIIYKEQQYRRELADLERRFTDVSRDVATLSDMQAQFFAIANHLPKAVSELNAALANAVTRDDAEGLKQFQQKSRELNDWIGQQKATSQQFKLIFYNVAVDTKTNPVMLTVHVGNLLDQVDVAYRVYAHSAQLLTNGVGRATGQEAKLAGLAKAGEDSKVLLNLANQAHAHGEAINLFLSGSTDWFGAVQRKISAWTATLRRVTLAASALAVIVLLTFLAVVGYRLNVRPLRVQLVERDQVIQRQERFAHLGELAAVVAHEIKNPLTAINARLFTLQRALAEGTEEHADATVIRAEIRRLDQIVKNFLKLDRSTELNLALVTAQPILDDVRDLFVAQLKEQSIELKTESQVEKPFRSDAEQIKQVLINLVQNAAESVGEHGSISLRARSGTTRLKGKESEVVIIEVEDTGPGIPPEIQERLFHPFFTTKQDGTGLGLPISARIVDKLGGKLDFQTSANHGTTFRVMLPLADRTG